LNAFEVETLFSRQIKYIFDRPVAERHWCWDLDHNPEEEDVFNGEDSFTAFLFLEKLCQKPGETLSYFSDDQVAQGFDFIFNSSLSNLCFGFREAQVDFERKVEVFASLRQLFFGVFEPRCKPVLSAYSQIRQGKLNGVCYMFWDVTPLAGPFSTPSKVENRALNEAVIGVMVACLKSKNPALVESGLHGLGHAVFFTPNLAQPPIDAFLKTQAGKQPAALLEYAKAARTGMIQ
jgi:hypothetical protein